MYKVADNVYGESECYDHGDEVRVETHLYFVDDDGNEHPVNEIYDLDVEPIDDYDTMNLLKYTWERFSIKARVSSCNLTLSLMATERLRREFDAKHRL